MTDTSRRERNSMRESKRTQILDAAARVVQRDGVGSVTYDTVAAEAGLTKGGLVYHFPSREALILAVHQRLADEWEASMAAAIDVGADEATETQKLQGYARAATQSSTRAELLMMLEGATTAEHAAPWNAVLERWTPAPPAADADERTLERFITRLAADGLWAYESLADRPLDPVVRGRLADLLAARFTDSDTGRDAFDE
ncbi:TetR/AcrR family transcriptional regulator [Rathayibacter sp. PhB152]|uniref:TetR/AcrR family transcriptional regulator n=1 Tax=Rathayibacter sp. PhB152 TaxID=2485190 RepID=UPI0021A7C621|nr:TetR/AcrR family transcriptional regulator [Rathayibacter sp. PhB152]